MSRLARWPRKKLAKTLFANTNSTDALTDAEIHSWIDAGELVTV